MQDSLNPEPPPSEPLYASESASGGASSTQGGSGAASGPQTGAQRLGPIDYARQQEAEREAADPADLREQYAPVDWQAIVTRRERELKTEGERRHQAEATNERVRAECDRIEAAVRANPTAPDFDGAYLAAIGHIRRALDPQEES